MSSAYMLTMTQSFKLGMLNSFVFCEFLSVYARGSIVKLKRRHDRVAHYTYTFSVNLLNFSGR